MVEVNAERRSESLDLPCPLSGDAHRTDDECGAERLVTELLALGGEHRDRLNGLAEAHVVGEDRTDPEVAEEPQPAVPACLEREEGKRHRRRRGQRLEAPFVSAREERAEAVVERDLAQLEPRVLDLDSRDRADEIDDGSLAAAIEELQRPLDLGAAQGVPAALDPDQRLLGGCELDELLLGERRIPDRELPVEPCECFRPEKSARAVGHARCDQVDP